MKTTHVLALALALAASALAQQPDTLRHSIPAPSTGTQTDGRLGASVAVDGGLTVLGAPYDDTGTVDSGVAKVFDTATGALLHVIPNPNPVQGDQFGASVAISGTRVVVVAPSADPSSLRHRLRL